MCKIIPFMKLKTFATSFYEQIYNIIVISPHLCYNSTYTGGMPNEF